MDLPSCVLAGLAGKTSEENAELAGIVDSMADGWCAVLLANFKQKNEELKVKLLSLLVLTISYLPSQYSIANFTITKVSTLSLIYYIPEIS